MPDVPPIRAIGPHEVIRLFGKQSPFKAFREIGIQRCRKLGITGMPQVASCDEDQPEVVPVVGAGILGDVFPVLPIVGVWDDILFVGMADDIIQVASDPVCVEHYRRQVGNQYIMGKIEVIFRRTGHGYQFSIKIMVVGLHNRFSPGN